MKLGFWENFPPEKLMKRWDGMPREGVGAPFPAGLKAVWMWHLGTRGSAGNGWARWDQRGFPTSTIPGFWVKHEEAALGRGHQGPPRMKGSCPLAPLPLSPSQVSLVPGLSPSVA